MPWTARFRRAGAAAALAAVATLAPIASAASRPPKLDYTMTTLPNGLNVVLLEDHSTPIVHVQVWYHVGSKNERPGRTGFAHLFEHMMFKGSKNVEPEGHPSYISSVGGQGNAVTNEDATVLWETLPSQYDPTALGPGAGRHPRGAAADEGKARHAAGGMAAAGGRRRAPHHVRRESRFVSAAHRVEDPVRRPELADLPQARLRNGDRAGGVRRGQHHRGSEPVLRRRDRAAGPHDRRSRQGADRGAGSAAERAGERDRVAAGQESVRARLHPGPRIGQGQ